MELIIYADSTERVKIQGKAHKISLKTREKKVTMCFELSLNNILEPRNAYFTGFLGSFYVR